LNLALFGCFLFLLLFSLQFAVLEAIRLRIDRVPLHHAPAWRRGAASAGQLQHRLIPNGGL
jgi:hypothetical protein